MLGTMVLAITLAGCGGSVPATGAATTGTSSVVATTTTGRQGPTRNAPTRRDQDADGLLDVDDLCPADAEDLDRFQDEDGCPDPDNDADGIADANDRCPLLAEDFDGHEDADGCPDP